jgi:hypothetical protein
MKIRYAGLSLLMILLKVSTNAQIMGDVPGKGLDMQTGPGGFVTQLPMAERETKGDVYLNSEWSTADIKVYGQQNELKQFRMRVDLNSNEIEINAQNQIKVLQGNRVERFQIVNSKDGAVEKYVNAKRYKLKGIQYHGFMKMIDSAKWQLLVKPQLKLIKSNYVAALDAGENSDKWVKEDIFFFAKDTTLYEVYSSAKKFTVQFDEDAEKVQSFIKMNKINLKQPTDLFKVITFLNSAL